MNEKMLSYNENIQFVFNKNIVEYDMKAASVSICERFNLLNKDIIEELKLLPKEKRTKRMGLMQRDNPEFSKALIEGIKNIREQFLNDNNINNDNIISLHSDAIIFINNKQIKNNIEGVEFINKNTWNSYIRYNKIEMFYNDDIITYKGIPLSMLNNHTLGINKYLCNIFKMIECYDTSIIDYINKFQQNYLQDKLPDYYYIPFGKTGENKLDNLQLFSYIAKIILIEMRKW